MSVSPVIQSGYLSERLLPRSVPPFRVSETTAEVLEDSRPVRGGRNAVPVRITGLRGRDTAVLFKGGERTVLCSGTVSYFKGQILLVSGVSSSKGMKDVLFADRDDIVTAGWTNRIYIFRAGIIKRVEKRISSLNHVPGSLLSAFLLGRKDSADSPLVSSFIRSGAAHLLALSGMHLGIITGFFMFLLTPLLGRKISFYLTLPVMIFYLFLTGVSPSLLRSLMLIVLTGVILTGYGRPYLPRLLSIVVVIHLLMDPRAADSVSFKLSYLALAGILWLGESVYRTLPGILPPVVRGILSASLSAQAATLPVAACYFGAVYPAGIVSSLVLSPLAAFFLPLGIIFILLPPPAFRILSPVLNILGAALFRSAGFFSRMPAVPASPGKAAALLTLILLGGILKTGTNGAAEKLRLGKRVKKISRRKRVCNAQEVRSKLSCFPRRKR